MDISDRTPAPNGPVLGSVDSEDKQTPGGPLAESVSVRLVDPGPRPLEVLGALSRMGCPADLASDYVGASAQGSRPEVLIGVAAEDAERVAVALRELSATVVVEPYIAADVTTQELAPEPPVDQSARMGRVAKLPPVEVVERYIAAYNACDQSRLMGCLSATAVLSDATGRVLVQGAEAIGRRMADIFRHYPDGRVVVLARMGAGPWVIEHHKATFGAGSSEETVMCFRVDHGSIDRVVLLTMT